MNAGEISPDVALQAIVGLARTDLPDSADPMLVVGRLVRATAAFQAIVIAQTAEFERRVPDVGDIAVASALYVDALQAFLALKPPTERRLETLRREAAVLPLVRP